jgi:hypothetical protein
MVSITFWSWKCHSNCKMFFSTQNDIFKCFFQLKMTFSTAYHNSWQYWIKLTTQSKHTCTCQFFNQHWGDKILVENDTPFQLTKHFQLLDEAHMPSSRSQSWTFNFFSTSWTIIRCFCLVTNVAKGLVIDS